MYFQSVIIVDKENHDEKYLLDYISDTILGDEHQISKQHTLVLKTPDEKQSIGVKEVSELIFWNNKRSEHVKISCILESENLTVEAQNSLLKAIEEPARNTLIVCVTNDEEKLLETVLSRCRIIKLEERQDVKVTARALEFFKADLAGRYKILQSYESDRAGMIDFIYDLLNYYKENTELFLSQKEEPNMIESWEKWNMIARQKSTNLKLIAESIILNNLTIKHE